MKRNTNIKTIAGIFAFLAVFLLAIFFSVIYHPGAGLYVSMRPVQEEPTNFMEFTQEELENYPYILKAVSSPGSDIKIPHEEEEVVNNIHDFDLILYNNDTEFIKVGDNYYHFNFEWAD